MKIVPSSCLLLLTALLAAPFHTLPAQQPVTAVVGELPADLAPLAARYQAAVAAVDKTRDAANSVARTTYLAALDGAEQKVTASGKTAPLKAILEEKNAVTSDRVSAVPDAQLPHELSTGRATYLRAIADTTRNIAPRYQAAQAAYLRDLGALEQRARAGKDQALLAAIGAEKLRVVGQAAPVVGAGASSTSNATKHTGGNLLLNANFSQRDALGKAVGWTVTDDVTLETEGGQTFARIHKGKGVGRLSQIVALPSGAKSVRMSARMRAEFERADGKGVFFINGTAQTSAGGLLHADGTTSAKGERLGYASVDASGKKWTLREITWPIPKGAASVQIDFSFHSRDEGVGDVNDAKVIIER